MFKLYIIICKSIFWDFDKTDLYAIKDGEKAEIPAEAEHGHYVRRGSLQSVIGSINPLKINKRLRRSTSVDTNNSDFRPLCRFRF